LSKSTNGVALLDAVEKGPWLLLAGSLSLGVVAGRLFAHSIAGLFGLVPLSMGFAWLLPRICPDNSRQLGSALCYSSGVVLSSAKFAEILELIRHGQHTVALRELPELFICVALPILIAFASVALVRLVFGEPVPQHKKTA